ncbi:adenomatous polyposis coli protein 2-like [Ovis canadensis]|uniref:adenomatous polyposis coli protein 2-like n=1 Tax=Ovis canadensis TaxID=37174 RepID=UPI0037526175
MQKFKRRQAGWFLEKPDFKAAQCSDALHSELAPNKEEPSTFTWAVDNFVEKCPPKGKTGNVPPGAEAPHNPRLCLPTAPWTDLTPTPPPGFLHPAEAAGRAARGPPPTARLQPLRTPAAAGNRPRAPGFPGSVRGASTVEVAASGRRRRRRRRRERAAWPLPRAGSATVGCGRRLRCVRGCASRSVRPRSDPEPARPARQPSSSSASPGGQLLPVARRAFEPPSPAYGFPRQENFASVPTSISRPLPPPPRGRARAHSHTHSHSPARVRTAARPEPRNLRRRYSHGLPAATGRPLSAAAAAEAAAGKAAAARPGLRARRPGQSPGEKRRRRARRRGGAAPRPPLVPRPQETAQIRGAGSACCLCHCGAVQPQVIRSQYDAVFIIPGGERAHHVQPAPERQSGSESHALRACPLPAGHPPRFTSHRLPCICRVS